VSAMPYTLAPSLERGHMSRERIDMDRLRELVRLHRLGTSTRDLAPRLPRPAQRGKALGVRACWAGVNRAEANVART